MSVVAGRVPEPRLATPRLLLRPYRAGDADALVEHLADFEVSRWLALVPHPYRAADAERFVARKLAPAPEDDHFGLAVELDGRLVGGLGVAGASTRPSLGYWLGRPFWGRGLMTEAVGALIGFLFGRIRLERLESGVFVGNEASLAIQRRLGFEFVGESPVFSVARGETVTHIDTLLTRRRYDEINA